MTKQELIKIIKDNFTNKYGDIYLIDLEFDTNVCISGMKVEGDLHQDRQRVRGDLYQSGQRVRGHLYQDSQRVRGDLHQDSQEVEGKIYK